MFQVLCLLLLFGIWYRLQYDNHNSRPNGNHEYIDSSFHNSNMKEGEDAGSASIPRAYARGFESAVKICISIDKKATIEAKIPKTVIKLALSVICLSSNLSRSHFNTLRKQIRIQASSINASYESA